MSDLGYVALHRKVRTKKWWYHNVTRMVFTELLINVTWKPYRFGNIDLEPGQWAFKRPDLAKKLGLQLHSLNRSLLSLQKDHVCTYEKADNQTLITLVKWQDYQLLNDAQSGQDVPTNVPTNVPTSVPTNVPTNVPTFKEQEKRRKKKEVYTWPHGLNDSDFIDAWKANRKAKRMSVTQGAIDLMGKNLQKAIDKGHSPDKIRELVIERSWCSLKPEWLDKEPHGLGDSHDEIIAKVRAARANVI